MLDTYQIAVWLRDSGEENAAHVIEQCLLNFIYVDTLFELNGERETDLVDLNIEAPARVLRHISGPLAKQVSLIEEAATAMAPALNCHIRQINWVPRIPSACEAAEREITERLAVVDSQHVRDAWNKARERKDADPDGALTSARTLLEAVSKHVMEKAGLVPSDAMSLPTLYHLAAQTARITPSQQADKLIRKVLGNCEAVVTGIAEMRNRLGDAHGKGSSGEKPTPIHAELAVNLAGAIALFLERTAEAEPPSV